MRSDGCRLCFNNQGDAPRVAAAEPEAGNQAGALAADKAA